MHMGWEDSVCGGATPGEQHGFYWMSAEEALAYGMVDEVLVKGRNRG